MAAISKSGTTIYYEKDRIWEEAVQCGLPPFYIGKWTGNFKIPTEPSKDVLRALGDGKPLGRVQANRVAVFDHTFSWDKSVTYVTYGMTHPKEWGTWTKEFARIVRQAMEPELSSQFAKRGAQGAVREPSQGFALVFPGWRGAFGQLQAHQHCVVFNLTNTKAGETFSIGNSLTAYERQAYLRAVSNKLMDDLLQSKGFTTRREGKVVAVDGIPREMIMALSPSRRAMEEAKKSAIRNKGKAPRGPRAEDFRAATANRQGKRKAGKVTPEQAYQNCQKVAALYGVTAEKLKGTPKPSDPIGTQYAAWEVALEARDACTKKFGSFTKEQFLTQLYTLGIGRAVTFDVLKKTADHVLRDRAIAGVERTTTDDGHTRYVVPPQPGQAAGLRQNGKAHEKHPDAAESLKWVEAPFVREAWKEFAAAAKGLGGAVLVATAKKATDAITRATEFVNPTAKILRIDAAELGQFVDAHRRTPFLAAHVKAFFAGLKARGNPHDRAFVAERVFEALRAYTRVPKNTVIVVERGQLATAPELRALAKIAKRDRCSVILSERPAPEQAAKPQRAHKARGKHQALRQSLREHGFRPNKDRLH